MNEDIINFNYELPSIKKQYHEYQIELFTNSNSSLNILIKNDFYYYESNFNEDSLKQIFNNSDIQVIYNSINELINKNEIKIEKNKKILIEEEKENLWNENKKEIENKEDYSISI